MAQAGVTTTGLKEMRAGVRLLPDVVQQRLRSVAQSTAQRVLANAKANLLRQTKGTGATAAAITMVEVREEKAFEVHSSAPSNRHPALPVFLEFGTRNMAARPYMGPALFNESGRYRRDMEIASIEAAEEVLG